jgi:formate C-acetyltransferase
LTEGDALELLEDFFLNCNKDSDLYPGMQQGDNGQSVVLGGRNQKGECLFNELSGLCLKASYELNLIDPKINIRVDKNTPLEIFEAGSELTKIGLGFPQYSNDDVVIPGLIEKGYSEADACDYVVAACWEFIIPKVGMDIPNIDAVSLIGCVSSCMEKLDSCASYEDFYRLVENEIQSRVDAICKKHRKLYMIPAPMMSVLMDGTIENGRDISLGARYNNYGIHGTGIASAADSLAAVKKYCFDEKRMASAVFLDALKNNFDGYEDVRKLLRYETPKMGQDDDYVDNIAVDLLDSFAQSVKDKTNERGGIYRAGTGTAMYYVFHSQNLEATPDGRDAGEAIPANYSPNIFIRQNGPLSVIKSFTKPALHKVINGGPLTLEFDQSIFNSEESVAKLAGLVQIFIKLGGHQLQLNTLSREKLLDAKAHPENYRNLIVRVWGWSGYFVELDECYQDHVLQRIEFQFQK